MSSFINRAAYVFNAILIRAFIACCSVVAFIAIGEGWRHANAWSHDEVSDSSAGRLLNNLYPSSRNMVLQGKEKDLRITFDQAFSPEFPNIPTCASSVREVGGDLVMESDPKKACPTPDPTLIRTELLIGSGILEEIQAKQPNANGFRIVPGVIGEPESMRRGLTYFVRPVPNRPNDKTPSLDCRTEIDFNVMSERDGTLVWVPTLTDFPLDMCISGK